MSALNRLDDLACDAELLPQAEFLQKHNRLYLYGNVPESSVIIAPGTFTGTFTEFAQRRTGGRSIRFVQAVEKSGRNDWTRRISVGRSGNNDIVLRHESVSKLHAYFFVRRSRPRLRVVEELILVDADSSNGTIRNGRSVSADPEHGKVVTFGETIAFGHVECEFLDVSGLYERLRARIISDF